jgi:hypothetical protein
MTRRWMQLRFSAIALFAAAAGFAASSVAVSPAHAFSMESLSTNGGNTTRFADPDERVKNFGQGAQPFGQTGPTVQFGGGQSSSRPFGPRSYAPPAPLVGGN